MQVWYERTSFHCWVVIPTHFWHISKWNRVSKRNTHGFKIKITVATTRFVPPQMQHRKSTKQWPSPLTLCLLLFESLWSCIIFSFHHLGKILFYFWWRCFVCRRLWFYMERIGATLPELFSIHSILRDLERFRVSRGWKLLSRVKFVEECGNVCARWVL